MIPLKEENVANPTQSHVKETAINFGLTEQKLDGIMSDGSLTFIAVFGYISSLKNQGFEA